MGTRCHIGQFSKVAQPFVLEQRFFFYLPPRSVCLIVGTAASFLFDTYLPDFLVKPHGSSVTGFDPFLIRSLPGREQVLRG